MELSRGCKGGWGGRSLSEIKTPEKKCAGCTSKDDLRQWQTVFVINNEGVLSLIIISVLTYSIIYFRFLFASSWTFFFFSFPIMYYI